MNQDELSKAIINILKKEMGAVKDILPSDLLQNLQKVIGPEIEKLIEKSGYVSKSKYIISFKSLLCLGSGKKSLMR